MENSRKNIEILPLIDNFFDDLEVDKKTVDEWSLVLFSIGIAHSVEERESGFVIVLESTEDNNRAAKEIIEYVEGIKAKSIYSKSQKKRDRKIFSIVTFLWFLFFIFFLLTETTENLFHWKYIGINSAFKVKQGEFWRIVTALFLHGDIAHFLGNMLVGFLSFSALSMYLGVGSSTLLFILSGSLGNYLNICFRNFHLSLGASTSIFGVIGVMIGLQFYREYRNRKWLMMTAMLIILALLGTAGENTDFGAHFFGMLSGVIFGIIYHAFDIKYGLRKPLFQTIFFISSFLIFSISWILSFFIIL